MMEKLDVSKDLDPKYFWDVDPGTLELGTNALQVIPRFLDLLAGRIRAVVLGGNTGGDMEEHEAALQLCGQKFDVFDDGAVGRRAVERDEYLFVHVMYGQGYCPTRIRHPVLSDSGRL